MRLEFQYFATKRKSNKKLAILKFIKTFILYNNVEKLFTNWLNGPINNQITIFTTLDSR